MTQRFLPAQVAALGGNHFLQILDFDVTRDLSKLECGFHFFVKIWILDLIIGNVYEWRIKRLSESNIHFVVHAIRITKFLDCVFELGEDVF